MYAERLPRLTTSQLLLLNSIFVRRMNSSSTPSLNFAICGKTVPGPFRRAAPSTTTFKSFLGPTNIEFGDDTDVVIGEVGVGFWVKGGKGATSLLESENLTNMGLETKYSIELIETLIL